MGLNSFFSHFLFLTPTVEQSCFFRGESFAEVMFYGMSVLWNVSIDMILVSILVDAKPIAPTELLHVAIDEALKHC